LINIYASIDSSVRIELWEELIRVLPQDCRFVLLGDFNFVEFLEDKSNLCEKLLPQGEKMVFFQLQNSLGIENRYPATCPIHFSWDNRQQDGVCIFARLDRIYFFEALAPRLDPV
jgi:hypothetical protein